MDLYHLRTFVTVAEEGHLTRAADRLHTSPPAISSHIKALEEELGVTLFERTPKGMTLTAAGELLRRQAEHTLAAASEFVLQAKRLNKEVIGEVRIALNTDAPFLRVTELHARLAQHYPRLNVSFLDSTSADILDDLRGETLDAGFFFGEQHPPEVAALRLHETEMAIVGPAAWADRLVGATLLELAALPWITTTTRCPYFRLANKLFDAHDLKPVRVVTSEQEAAVRALVESGIGIALVRADEALTLEHADRCCKWSGAVPRIPLHFGYPQRRERDPLIHALRESVQAVWNVPTSAAALGDSA